MRTLKEVLHAVADNAHDRSTGGVDTAAWDARHAKLLAEAELPRYPVIVDGMYGVVLLPEVVWSDVTENAPHWAPTPRVKYLCANGEEVAQLKAIGVGVPDEVTFGWFKVLCASV